jgi:hypothetical protein
MANLFWRGTLSKNFSRYKSLLKNTSLPVIKFKICHRCTKLLGLRDIYAATRKSEWHHTG